MKVVPAVDNSTTVIAKLVRPPVDQVHKHGWSDEVAHQRKLDSYENEIAWYQQPSQLCGERCRVPRFIASKPERDGKHTTGWLLIMEDLDAAGFSLRRQSVTQQQTTACLKWLANFHATFMVDMDETNAIHPAVTHRIWPIGNYWHLQTRPHELQAMQAGELKQNAAKIDAKLSAARFKHWSMATRSWQTFVSRRLIKWPQSTFNMLVVDAGSKMLRTSSAAVLMTTNASRKNSSCWRSISSS